MAKSEKEFPWQHSFPPFYTLQPHQETRRKQIETWCNIVLDYCRRRRLTAIDVNEIAASSLFQNSDIKRRLNEEFLGVLFESLRTKGNLEWTDKSKRRAHIYWRSPKEWGSLIYKFVKENGQIGNTVCTFYELTEGSDTVGQPFHGLDQELLVKSLKTLVDERRAELFPNDEGVKFF